MATGYEEARRAIETKGAVPHELWILLSNESDRDGYALKPSPWEGPGEYQYVEFGSDRTRLIKLPSGARSLIALAEKSA